MSLVQKANTTHKDENECTALGLLFLPQVGVRNTEVHPPLALASSERGPGRQVLPSPGPSVHTALGTGNPLLPRVTRGVKQGMENSLQEAHLRAASSVSSCSALQKISSASRSLMNLPTVVLCPETEILLRFTGGILFLSHGAKQNGKDGQPPFCKDHASPLPLTHHASDFYILLGLISFVKGKRKKKKTHNKTKQNKRKKLGTLLRTRKEKLEEGEAFDVT
ncbi:uncharacterized protein LOC113604531 [Acinonyx jubatus]|uniref:Uncharacterized protein LOC113604531 n=1 Tax=Acinonyx jubatus TaxID=32536 RepID=A0ABM3PW77_ACIJB|nr:uncharacterized protein LOC113604531 [Acinonyx jubatus]